MKYAHLFSTQSEHDQAYVNKASGGKYIQPWVAYIKEEKEVTFNKEFSKRYLTIEMLESGTCKFQIANNLPTSSCTSVSYSIDGGETWTTTQNVDDSLVTITIPNLSAGDKVLWKGNASTYSTAYTGAETTNSKFAMGATKYNVYGNIASMLYGDNFEEGSLLLTKSYTFSNFFWKETGLVSAENLVLPFTKVEAYSYARMFELCSSLTTPPQIPATTLIHDCYYRMFGNCAKLKIAPKLIATTLATWCYAAMFYYCTSLTKAPDLIAKTLTSSCYRQMFSGCANLRYIKMLATSNFSATDCLTSWVDGVAATGTFVKNSETNWNTSGVNGIPDGWTVQTASS